MNIHLPAILGFTRYQGFDPSPFWIQIWNHPALPIRPIPIATRQALCLLTMPMRVLIVTTSRCRNQPGLLEQTVSLETVYWISSINQPCCLMTLWNTFRVLTCFINFGRAANMKVNLVVYVHYILQLQDEKNIWNNQQKWLLWIVNQLNVGQPQLGYLRISPRLNPTNELIGRLIAIGFVMAVEIVLIC